MKRTPVFLGACFLLAASAAAVGHAGDLPSSDHRGAPFQMSTDMLMFGSPSTALFLGWQQDANALLRAGLDGVASYFDLLGPGRELSRFFTLAVFAGAGLVVNQAFSLTAHDERHMDTARALGATGVTLVRSDSGQEMTIWQFLLEAFNFTAEPGLYSYSLGSPTQAELAYVSAVGLDTNMLIADTISRNIDEGEGHVTDLAPYMLNKLWGIGYVQQTGPTSDAGNYISELNAQGYIDVTRASIMSLHLLSFFLSGGFLGLVRGTYNFVFRGESDVTPLGLEIGHVSVFWPELTTWLNPDNVSFQVSVDAAWRNTILLRAGMDTPVFGNTAAGSEVTFGVAAKIQPVTVALEFTSRFAGVPLCIGRLDVALSDLLSLGVEGHYGEGNTMRERREYPLGPGAAGVVTIRL
jgi:hypothetical protein